MKYLVSVLLLLSISACCSKKYCIGNLPEIIIKLESVQTYNIDSKLYALNINTGMREDSITAFVYNRYLSIKPNTFANDHLDAYNYIIETEAGVTDTIKDISYQVNNETVECNQCFGGGHSLQSIVVYSNFKYTYAGNIYTAYNTLVITQ